MRDDTGDGRQLPEDLDQVNDQVLALATSAAAIAGTGEKMRTYKLVLHDAIVAYSIVEGEPLDSVPWEEGETVRDVCLFLTPEVVAALLHIIRNYQQNGLACTPDSAARDAILHYATQFRDRHAGGSNGRI